MLWYQLGWCCGNAIQQVYQGLGLTRQLII